ncbi:hypothetical protein FDK21_18875 [Cohaesibacter sp. CAU 1516]|uniref:hypothetical protein n=1 Tax=Cohaesibacter sp. CAU 1516 TaxID=2576038 RepID=UPI0010FEB8BB|nr:hypothetical protein [Cohaesibacter sp. CAU 1516]TLP42891.1 hypothetical protein FDK21_18875 [Cohaesibacter sp. CAU 1516]
MEIAFVLCAVFFVGCLLWTISEKAFCLYWAGSCVAMFVTSYSLPMASEGRLIMLGISFWMLMSVSLQLNETFGDGDRGL